MGAQPGTHFFVVVQLPRMIPPADHRCLAATAIDLGDRTYFFAPEAIPPSPQLVDSIREFGILHPPLVQRHGERYLVITGWKRLEAAITILRRETVPCIVVPSSWPAISLHELILEQALLSPSFSLAEQSAFLVSLGKACPEEEILPFLARMGYRPTRQQLSELLSLHQLATATILALHRGAVSPAAARKLRNLAHPDQDTLVALLTRFQFGGSKQQKLIELALELQRRAGGSIAEIVAPFLKNLEEARQDNIPQHAAALLSWLHGQCFPRSTRAEQEFSRKVAQLNLPADMQVAHAPFFEEDTVTLSLKFTDWNGLLSALPSISHIPDAE